MKAVALGQLLGAGKAGEGTIQASTSLPSTVYRLPSTGVVLQTPVTVLVLLSCSQSFPLPFPSFPRRRESRVAQASCLQSSPVCSPALRRKMEGAGYPDRLKTELRTLGSAAPVRGLGFSPLLTPGSFFVVTRGYIPSPAAQA
jgi:hypothetical protein